MGVRVRAGLVVLAVGAGCGLAAGQAAGTAAVPGAKAPAAMRLVLTLKGRGVQIYNCQAAARGDGGLGAAGTGGGPAGWQME